MNFSRWLSCVMLACLAACWLLVPGWRALVVTVGLAAFWAAASVMAPHPGTRAAAPLAVGLGEPNVGYGSMHLQDDQGAWLAELEARGYIGGWESGAMISADKEERWPAHEGPYQLAEIPAPITPTCPRCGQHPILLNHGPHCPQCGWTSADYQQWEMSGANIDDLMTSTGKTVDDLSSSPAPVERDRGAAEPPTAAPVPPDPGAPTPEAGPGAGVSPFTPVTTAASHGEDLSETPMADSPAPDPGDTLFRARLVADVVRDIQQRDAGAMIYMDRQREWANAYLADLRERL